MDITLAKEYISLGDHIEEILVRTAQEYFNSAASIDDIAVKQAKEM